MYTVWNVMHNKSVLTCSTCLHMTSSRHCIKENSTCVCSINVLVKFKSIFKNFFFIINCLNKMHVLRGSASIYWKLHIVKKCEFKQGNYELNFTFDSTSKIIHPQSNRRLYRNSKTTIFSGTNWWTFAFLVYFKTVKDLYISIHDIMNCLWNSRTTYSVILSASTKFECQKKKKKLIKTFSGAFTIRKTFVDKFSFRTVFFFVLQKSK